MKFVDKNIAILKDNSVIIFHDDKNVELFNEYGWKTQTNDYNRPLIYDNKATAIKIWEEIEKILINKN